MAIRSCAAVTSAVGEARQQVALRGEPGVDAELARPGRGRTGGTTRRAGPPTRCRPASGRCPAARLLAPWPSGPLLQQDDPVEPGLAAGSRRTRRRRSRRRRRPRRPSWRREALARRRCWHRLNVQSRLGPIVRAESGTSMYGLSDEDLEIQARARTFADELIPFEVERRADRRRAAARTSWPRTRRGPSSSGCSRRTCRVSSAAAAAPRCSRSWSRSRSAGSPTRWPGSVATPPSWLPEVATPYQMERSCGRPSAASGTSATRSPRRAPGSDVDAIEATARRDGDDYVLNGVKWHVTSYNCGRLRVLPGQAVGGEHAGEHAMFLVDLPSPGVQVVRTPAYIAHDAATITRSSRSGRPGARRAPGRGRGRRHDVRLRVVPVRAADGRRALPRRGRAAGRRDDRVRHGADRVQGTPISEFGAVQAMLADSLTELFAARSLVYETARAIDAGADVKVQHAQCSMAKLYASEMAGRVADRAVQVFGGRGYMRENVAERFFRELRVERIWEGTSEIQRAIIADQMVKRGPGGARLTRPAASSPGDCRLAPPGSKSAERFRSARLLADKSKPQRLPRSTGRLPSIAATRAGSSGSVSGRNRPSTVPSGPDQELLEVPLDVAGLALGVGRLRSAPCRAGAGPGRSPRSSRTSGTSRRSSPSRTRRSRRRCPAPGRRTGCTGSRPPRSPRSPNRSCSRSSPSYCGVRPHLEATLTTSSVLPDRSASERGLAGQGVHGEVVHTHVTRSFAVRANVPTSTAPPVSLFRATHSAPGLSGAGWRWADEPGAVSWA